MGGIPQEAIPWEVSHRRYPTGNYPWDVIP